MSDKILVIDDEVEVRGVMQKCLAARGYDVTALPVNTENEAEQATGITLSEDFDLYLIDLKLPYINTLGLIERLCKQGKEDRIIIVAGYIPPGLRAHMVTLGITRFLQKPFLFSKLRNIVQRTLDAVCQ